MPYIGNTSQKFVTADDITVTDDLTVTDDASVGGDLTVTGIVQAGGGNAPTKGFQLPRVNGTLTPRITNDASDQTCIRPGVSGGNVAFNNFANSAGNMTIADAGDIKIERGDIFFGTAGKGIVLGATSNVDANTLHDYEEGTWTPRITASTAGVATPTSDNGGTYVKVGDMVTLNFGIYWDAVTTTMNGSRRISGLPFSSANITGNQSGNFMGPHYNGMLQSGHLNFMALPPNVNYIEVISVNSDGTNNASGHNYDHSGMSMPSAGNHTSMTMVYRAA